MPLSKDEIKQYNRHLILDEIGESGQLKLRQSKVLVIGAGGLGCPILQYLSAAGVGTIGIIDDDKVDQSNLQRQILFAISDVGEFKVTAAIKRLNGLNPFVNFIPHLCRLNTENALSIFQGYDIIVDGSDNFPTRYLANDASAISKKPLVFGSIFKFEGQVSVFNYQNGPTYRCLFPNPPGPNEVPNCSEIGVLGVLPGIIGSIQANEVLKILLGIGNVLSGQLLTYNTLNNTQYIIKFDKNEALKINSLDSNYEIFCGLKELEFDLEYGSVKDQLNDYSLIDVRELWERDIANIGGIHIPLAELPQRLKELEGSKPILIYCQTGSRSQIARQLFIDFNDKLEVFCIKDGIENISI